MTGSADKRGEARRDAASLRSVVGLTLLALLTVSTLGALHAAEHDVGHESTPCDACIAAASPGVLTGVALDLGGSPDSDVLPARTHQDPAAMRRAIRHPARAPPSRHS